MVLLFVINKILTMICLLFFFILIIGLLLLHFIKQKKSIFIFNQVLYSLQYQLDLEEHKSQRLNENLNLNYKTNFQLDILKKQVQLLEIISNQMNQI